MKHLFIILNFLLISPLLQAQQTVYRVYRVNGQPILIPEERKKELKGIGMVMNNTINFETVKDEKGVETKKAWLWIGGCGKTYINNDPKILDLKQGTRIRVRMSAEGKCNISSWEVFK
jgi:hypothetical protein